MYDAQNGVKMHCWQAFNQFFCWYCARWLLYWQDWCFNHRQQWKIWLHTINCWVCSTQRSYNLFMCIFVLHPLNAQIMLHNNLFRCSLFHCSPNMIYYWKIQTCMHSCLRICITIEQKELYFGNQVSRSAFFTQNNILYCNRTFNHAADHSVWDLFP